MTPDETFRDNRFQPHTPLGAGPEFDAIRRMLERWGPHAHRVGDDAAVITTVGERAVVVSTDTSVENVHFKREWLTPSEIGYRAAAAALSDLAAMGAKPLGMLVAMALPEKWRDSLDGLSDGIGEAAQIAGAPIIGGDMSGGSELSLTFTVLGTASDLLLRTAARPGDAVYMTGSIGGPGAALNAFESGSQPLAVHRERFAHPVPRIREAQWLVENGAASGIDVSDGLSGDLAHLAAASGVAIAVELERLPLAEGVSPIDALRSGEEYELVVTAPTDLDVETFAQRFGIPLTRIGSVQKGAGVTFTQNGEPVEAPSGYLHFQ